MSALDNVHYGFGQIILIQILSQIIHSKTVIHSGTFLCVAWSVLIWIIRKFSCAFLLELAEHK